jgi:hypothetical protein
VGLEEDIVQSCVKYMNDCAKRIEQLKSLKVNEDYEAQLRPLITKEIEKCVNEYLKTLTFLTKKIEEIQQVPLSTEKEPEDTTNVEELPYKLLVKLLQSNGLIDEEGNLTEKGAKLLEEELRVKEYTPVTEPVEGEDSQIKESQERKNGLEFIKSLGLFEEPEKEDVWLSELSEKIDETKSFDIFQREELPEEEKDNEVLSLEGEIRYLIEKRGKTESISDENLVICPNCLSKVELKDNCSVCDYRLIKEKKPLEEKLEEPEVPSEEKPLETAIEGDLIEDQVFQEKEIPQDIHRLHILGGEDLPRLFVNFLSYVTISEGLVILSGCIFTILLSVRGLEEAKLGLAELLYVVVDSLPGVPFSSGILSPLSFNLGIGLIAIFGFIMILTGFGLRRDLRISKLSGVVIFVLSSLIDVYSILIIDFSETIIPFLSLVINIVIVYMILNRLLWPEAES